MSWFDSIVAVIFLAALAYVIYYAYVSITAFTKMFKETKVLKPEPLDACPKGMDRSGQLCYKKCNKGGRTDYWNRIAATCWLKEVGVGIGVVKELSRCGPGERDDGLFCWRK